MIQQVHFSHIISLNFAQVVFLRSDWLKSWKFSLSFRDMSGYEHDGVEWWGPNEQQIDDVCVRAAVESRLQ